MAFTTPATAVAGSVLTAAWLNTYVRDQFNALTSWQSYTPTWTGGSPSIGDGTLQGKYISAQGLVLLDFYFVVGASTNLGSTHWSFSLPVAAVDTNGQSLHAFLSDVSITTAYLAGAIFNSTSTFQLWADGASSPFSGSAPFAWAVGDYIRLTGAYRAA